MNNPSLVFPEKIYDKLKNGESQYNTITTSTEIIFLKNEDQKALPPFYPSELDFNIYSTSQIKAHWA